MSRSAKGKIAVRDTVLIVDDDGDVRSLITTVCEINGIRVLEAADCSSALKVLAREHDRVRLVLLDYFMPGMEPIKCVNTVVDKAGTSIAVFLLTAADNAAARAANLRVSGWLSKPFEVSGIAELFYAASFPQKEKKK